MSSNQNTTTTTTRAISGALATALIREQVKDYFAWEPIHKLSVRTYFAPKTPGSYSVVSVAWNLVHDAPSKDAMDAYCKRFIGQPFTATVSIKTKGGQVDAGETVRLLVSQIAAQPMELPAEVVAEIEAARGESQGGPCPILGTTDRTALGGKINQILALDDKGEHMALVIRLPRKGGFALIECWADEKMSKPGVFSGAVLDQEAVDQMLTNWEAGLRPKLDGSVVNAQGETVAEDVKPAAAAKPAKKTAKK